MKYEYVCFLHDKKEKEDFLKEDIAKWIRSLWENMIGSKEYINNILYTFHMNSQLGLLIPPFPFSEHFTFSIYTNPWQEDFFVTRDLANQMNLKCEIDHMRQPVTLGTAFWARVSALKKLFEREWRYEDFPDEPMDNDGTISHAIERILAYVAQDAEFETHWVLTDKYAAEEFDYMQMLLRKSFERLNQSLDIRNVFELNNYELRTEKLLSFIDRFERFYIYGAGVRGKRYCSFLKKFQKKPAGFLVSDKSKNANSVNGVPVYSLSEIELDEKCGIIIGVSEKYQDEILLRLKKKRSIFPIYIINKKRLNTMKIIVYATGQVFEQYKEKIRWKDIILICDKKADHSFFTYQNYTVSMVMPDALQDIEYDFIAVFSNIYFEEIRMELVGKYFVSKNKIIPWRAIIPGADTTKTDAFTFFRPYFQERKYKRFLDVGMNFLSGRYLAKTEFTLGEDIVLDGISGESAIYNQNLYDHVYKRISDCEERYDLIFLSDEQYQDDMLDHFCGRTKTMIYSAKGNGILKEKYDQNRLKKYGRWKCISTMEGDFYLIDLERKTVPEDISIYIIIHKKYNIYSDDIYRPLCVGDYQEEGRLTEKSGDNISYLNKKINECSALYWIWKNTNTEIVGLNHYRRYFYNNEINNMDNYLDAEHVSGIMKDYDIILPVTMPLEQLTIYQQLETTMNPELCQKGYSIIRKKIEEKQPDYLWAFDSVMQGHVVFNCNIFVTKREILNRYCEWLFSFLIGAAEEIDVEGYDSYSQRVMGFFAERMWTVWLRKNKLRIKELPYVLIR